MNYEKANMSHCIFEKSYFLEDAIFRGSQYE